MNQQNTINRVKSNYNGFEDAFSILPSNKVLPVRKELMNCLDWSVSLFYYKKRGDTPIWEHEVPVIEEIFSQFKINAWTGKPINN